MTTGTASPGLVPRQGTGRPPERRGATTVTERAVATIATAAVSEVSGTSTLTGRLGGLAGGGGASRSHARVSGATVTLRLAIAARYPGPLRRVSREVRAHVKRRVEECTGLSVRHIDIEIAELVPARRAR